MKVENNWILSRNWTKRRNEVKKEEHKVIVKVIKSNGKQLKLWWEANQGVVTIETALESVDDDDDKGRWEREREGLKMMMSELVYKQLEGKSESKLKGSVLESLSTPFTQ